MDLIAVGYSLGLAASVLYLGGIGDRFGRNLVLILRMVLAGPGESDRGLRAERQHPRRCARGEVGRRPVSLAIESTNARYRRAIKARGHFPSEQAAMKCLYLVTRSLDPTGAGRARWMMRWKPALNAFAITFGDRFPAAETY